MVRGEPGGPAASPAPRGRPGPARRAAIGTGRGRRRALRVLPGLLAALAAGGGVARAGHELPFYPGYYPQEIRIETVPAAAAGPLLAKSALHAYVGADPFEGRRVPPDIGTAESLGSYLVVTFNPASASFASPERRCEAAGRIVAALPRAAGWVAHPYPVTPFHADYLAHVDLIDKRRRALPEAGPRMPGGIALRARGALAEKLVAPSRDAGAAWDAAVEEVDLDALLAPARVAVNGWLGPPWLKQGWFHAYLLEAAALTAGPARRAAEDLYERLTGGAGGSLPERLDLERKLVTQLGAGCERVVAGYTVRRERFSSEFSAGVENVALDSHAGFNSAIFVRTVKLKDFPWNGWLRLGIATPAAAAWNPVGGFTDAAGRLIWAAVGDPALLPAPYGAGWLPNRVTPADVRIGAEAAVPEDALLPEAGTGVPREVGKGRSARARITYRVVASAFHDNTRMTAADAVAPYLFAARWGARRAGAAAPAEYDAAVDAATALARRALAGFRILRVDSEVKKYSDITFTYAVPVVEVYLNPLALDPQAVAAEAAPWSALPWHVLALMDEAVRRGVGALSAEEARRRGVPWLDLARDPKARAALLAMVDGFARQAWVPEPLRRFVTADDAQTRWTALRQYAQRRGHFLVTNGPYQLDKWADGAVTLEVFRDLSNPLGVGRYDRFAIPHRAYVTRVAVRGERIEVQAEVERVEKFLRDHRLVREPLAGAGAGGDRPETPVCHYVVVGADGAVAAAGASEEMAGGKLVVDLRGRLRPGAYTAAIALAAAENQVAPEVATAQFRIEASP